MSVHLQYLKHLQCRQLCTLVCVWMYGMTCQYEWDTQTYQTYAKDVYLNVKSVLHKKWGRGATDTCRSSGLWPNEVRRTRWTRIWPDSIIYTHALFSELYNDWKVLFDLYKQTASWAPPLTGPLSFELSISSILISKPRAQSNHTKKPCKRIAQCTL